jgi:hypothetical protein
MLMAMARSRSGRANASDVNCAPWSVLKISNLVGYLSTTARSA